MDWTIEEFIEAQKTDTELRGIYCLAGAQNGGDNTTRQNWGLICSNGRCCSCKIGYFTDGGSQPTDCRLSGNGFHPSSHRWEMTGGHLASRWCRPSWVNWKADMQCEVWRCHPIPQYFRGTPPQQAELRSLLVGQPWEWVAIDVTGKHPKSHNWNK